MNSKVFFYLFILISIATSCISEFNAKLPSGDKQILIVDGNISENSDAIFYLSKSIPMDITIVPQENLNVNAKLTLIGSNGFESVPATNLGKGKYQLHVGELVDNISYGIRIEYDGDIYESTLSKPIYTPEIDSISWIQPENEGLIFFRVSTHDNSDTPKFFMWNYTETWEITAFYENTLFFDPDKKMYYVDDSMPYFFCWRNYESESYLIGSTESLKENRIVNKQLYSREPGNDQFIVLYSVNVHQKAISKEAYDYYLNKIKLNEEMGGLFTPQPFELTGNISCITNPSKKVMGYIEITKNTTQKRIFVYPNEITRPWLKSFCEKITADSVARFLNEYRITYVDYYWLGNRPMGEIDILTSLPTEWSRVTCTDCRAIGGSKIKPDYWPNLHQ